MNDSLAMSRVQRVRNFNSQIQHLFKRKRFPSDAMFQRLAIERLHDDEGRAVLLVSLVDGANVGMVQGRSSLRLSLEASQRMGVFCHLVGEEFQSYEAMELDDA